MLSSKVERRTIINEKWNAVLGGGYKCHGSELVEIAHQGLVPASYPCPDQCRFREHCKQACSSVRIVQEPEPLQDWVWSLVWNLSTDPTWLTVCVEALKNYGQGSTGEMLAMGSSMV